MTRIVYIGKKEFKADSVAKTGLTWTRGEIHEVEDEAKAAKLLEHSQVWADADTDYKLAEIPAAEKPEPKPTVLIVPQGGENVSPYWEPVTIVVPAEVFKSLQDKEFVAVFMKPEDADGFQAYKENMKKQSGPEDLDWTNMYYKEREEKEELRRLLAIEIAARKAGIPPDGPKEVQPSEPESEFSEPKPVAPLPDGKFPVWELDKRSKAYKTWAAANPEEAAQRARCPMGV